MSDNPKSLTPEELQRLKIEEDRYRFGGFKYTLRSPAKYGPSDIIPQNVGLYSFPKGEETDITIINIYDKDAPI